MIRSPYLALFRPVTLAPVLVISFVFGVLGLPGHVDGATAPRLLLAAFLLTVANGGSNILNELSDFEEDAVHPSKQMRPLVSGQFSPTAALSGAVLVWGAALVAAAVFLGPVFSLLYGLILGFAWVYSFPPRLKARFPMNYLAISTPRGAIGIAAAWTVCGSILDPHLWIFLAALVPFVLFANETRNLDDREADLSAGIPTITTIWGGRAGRLFALIGFCAPAGVVLVLQLGRTDPLAVLTAVPPIAYAIAMRSWSGKRLWLLFYATFGILPFLLGAGDFFKKIF